MTKKNINNLSSEKIDGSTVKGGFGFKKLFGIFRGRGNSENPSDLPNDNRVSAGLPESNSAPSSPPGLTRDNAGGISTEGLPHFNPNSHSD